MKTKQMLILLANYFQATRGVGHTHALIHGALNSNCITLARDEPGARFLKRLHPNGVFVPLLEIKRQLCGLNKPMLIDNAALVEVIQNAIQEINRLEISVAELGGARGGKSKSPAKQAASRANGKKGGRHKKTSSNETN